MRKIKKTMFVILLVLFSALLVLSFPAVVSAAGTITPITTDGIDHFSPAIFGDRIVWFDARSGNSAIYLYTVTTGRETRVSYYDASAQEFPAIYGDLIAYQDNREGGTWDIYLYNITSGEMTQITNEPASDQSAPAIYGNRIVWHDSRTGNFTIYINGTAPGSETPVSPSASNQFAPSICGDLVIWLDDRNGMGYYDIYLYNLTSGLETQITNNPFVQPYPAAIYGNSVVWTDTRNGMSEIFMNGTSPGLEYSVTPNQPSSDHMYPSIWDSKVIWMQDSSAIYMNDTALASGSLIPIDTIPGSTPTVPKISVDPVYGVRVVWEELMTGNREIYLYTAGGPGICPSVNFVSDFSGGSAPKTLQFTDLSSPLFTGWFWDFGDGTNSTQKNPAHTYTQNGTFDVSLTTNNAWCRAVKKCPGCIVLGKPVANFSASPTSGIVPLTVAFTDSSQGMEGSVVKNWEWDFGDGSPVSTFQNPVHVYTQKGTYTVNLTVTNDFESGFRQKYAYITVLTGAYEVANTTIDGITIEVHGSRQYLVYNYTKLPHWTFNPNTSVLDFIPPADRGFRNITIYALDGAGFSLFSGNTTIQGNITGVTLQVKEIKPSGFPVETCCQCSLDYSVDLPSYPVGATITTNVWEGAIPADRTKFEQIAIGSNYAHYLGTAYTTRIIKTNFPAGGTAKFHMSANSTWVAGITDGRNHTFIERITDDGLTGEVLRTRFLNNDPVKNLDHFEADSPHGLSTFGISRLSGAGNPFQLVTFTISSIVSPPSNAGGGGGSNTGDVISVQQGVPIAVQPTSQPEKVPPPPEPKSAKIYANADGVITQATLLEASDNLATLAISLGIVARDANGKPLSSVSILPLSTLPTSIQPGGLFSFAGVAYELHPDGATFSPEATLTFPVPEGQWGKEFSIMGFDHATNTWQPVPITYNTQAGTVTAHLSHLCCFALFVKSPLPTPTALVAKTASPQPTKTPAPTLPQSNAGSIFSGMMVWVADLVTKNLVLSAGIVILACTLVFLWERKRRHRPVRFWY